MNPDCTFSMTRPAWVDAMIGTSENQRPYLRLVREKADEIGRRCCEREECVHPSPSSRPLRHVRDRVGTADIREPDFGLNHG